MDDHFHDKQQREWRGARGPYRDDRYNGIGITRTVILRLIQSLGVVLNRTLTTALDALGTAKHGAIIYRGASVWQILAPSTDGHVLTTHDVGFDPTWEPPGGSGTFTLTEEEIDFGSLPVWNGEFVVTAAGVVASDLILVSPSGNAPTGLTADEAAWDVIQYAADAGTGNFTLRAAAAPGPVSGKRKVYWTKVS